MGAVVAPLARPDAVAPERRRAAALAVILAAGGGIACALSFAAPVFHGMPLHPLDEVIQVGVAAAYIGAGVIALLRRPANATGLLMALVGFLWLVQDLYWIYEPLPYTIASTYEKLYQPALAQVALVFPTGKFAGRFERRVMVGVWTWSVTNNIVRMLFFDPNQNGCSGCKQLLLVDGDQDVYTAVDHTTTYLSAAITVGVAAVIVRHWWRATRAARQVMAPVLWLVAPAAAYLVANQLPDVITLSSQTQHVVQAYLPAGLAILPIGFLLGLLRTRLSYAQVGALLPELSKDLGPGRVRAALAASLRDPDLELLYWSPAGENYVDLDGQPREPIPGPGKAVSPIEGESGPLAVMIVDKVALDEPDLLRAAVAMARLALENERLQAEVRSQLLQLRSSTSRIVEAGQHARRRIERDLHDGAQQRLLALSMLLGRARSRAGAAGDAELSAFLNRAADDLQQAISELRELARGIHPMLLTQQGLASALQALAERAPLPIEVTATSRRFPETIEATAYFFVAEAVTNAARHAAASAVLVDAQVVGAELVVRVCDDGIGGVDEVTSPEGSGLLGMRDRVIAIGGRLTISSPVGAGTTLIARLPCG